MGALYIVATPIGNLKDITLRALEVLKTADYVLCEDTRVTGKLLKNFEIETRLVSFNDFNEEKKIGGVMKDLVGGKNIALVSDAGTPLVSDPGYKLAREAISAQIKVKTIPGATSVISALTVSGMPPDKFLFVGYLPKKDGKRKEALLRLKDVKDDLKLTLIAFESPYRLIKSLENIKEVFGNVEVVVCRELTKLHEEVKKGKPLELIDDYAKKSPKGEVVLLL